MLQARPLLLVFPFALGRQVVALASPTLPFPCRSNVQVLESAFVISWSPQRVIMAQVFMFSSPSWRSSLAWSAHGAAASVWHWKAWHIKHRHEHQKAPHSADELHPDVSSLLPWLEPLR